MTKQTTIVVIGSVRVNQFAFEISRATHKGPQRISQIGAIAVYVVIKILLTKKKKKKKKTVETRLEQIPYTTC